MTRLILMTSIVALLAATAADAQDKMARPDRPGPGGGGHGGGGRPERPGPGNGGPGRPTDKLPPGMNRPVRPDRPQIQPPRPNPGRPEIKPPRPDRPGGDHGRPPRPGHPRPPVPPHYRPPPGYWHGHHWGRPPLHRPGWHYPHGYSYRRWSTGLLLPAIFFSSAYYFTDYDVVGLYAPPPGYHWVRYGPDLLLVQRGTRRIVDVRYGVFR